MYTIRFWFKRIVLQGVIAIAVLLVWELAIVCISNLYTMNIQQPIKLLTHHFLKVVLLSKNDQPNPILGIKTTAVPMRSKTDTVQLIPIILFKNSR
ncbi:hypothetical protein [Flavobacterium sp. NKUCC04_CG]|uniref:hypothetical protein n=1 Tax=Flavobacterium sp. NKUCC04_CG TaxID=2842121 RepID=UPI001C5B8D1C|nr:hypothetical protein [Flavobacterium sp. NKUCC04_CG]MBW3519141.1 hypothetical protein [Flavobacterium sp. NKUCC04_CG]